jgi:phosphate-selective porin OprO/OprP
MFKRQWRKIIRLLFVGGVAAALAAGPAHADDRDDLRALKEQLELQKKQIEELQQKLGQVDLKSEGDPATGLPPSPKAAAPEKSAVEQMVADYLKRQEEEKKAKEAEAKVKLETEGFKVGSDLSMTARWNPFNGPTLSTPNKDFVSHIGFRFQMDSVWWDQSPNTKPAAQLGDLQDGVFFRRIRPSWDGQAWEVIEWNCELALEQIQNDVITLDQVYAGLMNVPYLGRVWVGHLKTVQGLEGDTTGSSKSMTFLERSMYTDAFYQNFSTGVLFGNSVLNQRLTYAFEWYRQDNGENGLNQVNNGADFADGSYGYSMRLTALPIWDNNGRTFLHLGVSYTWRDSERPNAVAGSEGDLGPTRLVEFRARPQLRDAIGDYGGTNGNNATPVGLGGDSRRMVDTGALAAPSNQVIGTEMMYVRGPFSVMGEWAWAAMDDARVVATAPGGTTGVNTTRLFHALPNGTRVGTPWFNGGYLQLGYFLTGENRTYDRRLGTVGGTYIASPYTPFWLTKAEDGKWLFGRGAWELAARWNYLDLNNGDIAGGKSNALELGVNWFLTTNLKFQFMYLWQDRYHMAPGQVPGKVEGFGCRTQFFF